MKTSCKSKTGVTVGLIDSLISISRVLAQRLKDEKTDYFVKSINEALRDLHSDPDLLFIMEIGPYNKNFMRKEDRESMDLINKAAEQLILTQKPIIV